jgi:DNA-binding NarL/FixJ family response regulator
MANSAQSNPNMPRRNIFIVEDHPIFREGLAQVLNGEPDLTVCGTAADVPQALKEIPRLKPQLVLVDIGLPGQSGLELIRKLRATDVETKLLVISMHDEALYADRVLRAGGDGYIMKQEDPEEILHAIRDVLAGHMYVSEEVVSATGAGSNGNGNGSGHASSTKQTNPVSQLTDSELELLEQFGQGKSNEEISAELGLSGSEVTARSKQLKTKLKLKTDNALVRFAVCWSEQGEV